MSAPARRTTGEVLTATVALAGIAAIDVGCGDGTLVRLMTRAGARVTGVEPGPRMLELALAAPRAGDERYLEAPAQALPFVGGIADLVVFSNSLHHVPPEHMAPALAEAARVLKPGGTLFVSEPVADGPFFAVTRLFNDETDVRARALAAMRDAGRWGLAQTEEFVHVTPMKSRDFAVFRDRSIAIEPSRASVFAAREAEIRAAFEANGKRGAEGYEFDNPTRVNVFRRA